MLHTTKVSLGHRAGRRYQYPAARSRLRMARIDIRLPSRWIICIRRRGAEMKRFVLTIRSSWRSSCGVEIFIEPPRFLWCGRPVPRLRRKICLCILETPPTSWLFLAENCHLPTTWQFPRLYRNPSLHKSITVVMASQTSLRVTSPEPTFFILLSLSCPQTILNVFGHSIWSRNGSMKSTVFRFEIEHTTRNNKYRSNSRKCHLLVVIP